MAAFETAQISAAAAFVDCLHTKGTSISADEWDLSRENRQSIFFSTRLKAVRCVSQDLFMFNFKTYSTVQWKLTVKTPAHALLQCHVIVKQAHGRAALLRGYYPWRVAINPEEMLVVKLLETGEEFIDDKLTDIELNLLCGMYSTSTSQQASLSWYPPTIKFEQSGRNPGRWTEVEETKFLVWHRRQMEEGSSNADGIE
ncbi:hypothetical protein BYT27DRAFT_7210975 [Phlegmacium glaucopus]|nr:hypothetical protein BYT27DRAFT_7210975 [Phlegmacium glaucopus]